MLASGNIMIQDDKIQLALDCFEKSNNNHVSIDDLILMLNSKAQTKEILCDVDLDGDIFLLMNLRKP